MVKFMCDVDRVECNAYAVANIVDDENVARRDKYKLAVFFAYEKIPKFLNELVLVGFSRDYIKSINSINKEIQTDLDSVILDSRRYKELGLTIRDGVLPKQDKVGLP